MPQELSIVQLLLNASWVVQAVVVLLGLVSIISWAAIIRKVFALKRVRAGNEAFEREFWSGRSLTEMNQQAGSKVDAAPLERIFGSGMREFLKLRERQLDAPAQLDGARRAMRASFQRELDVIESHLSFLARSFRNPRMPEAKMRSIGALRAVAGLPLAAW